MNRLARAFNRQQSKYGGYTTLLTTMVIIIVIVINLLVGEIDLTFDASVNRVFSISEESEEIAKAVTEPVGIYGLYEIGAESEGYDIIISNYTKLSNNITAKNIDPVKNPAFSMKYAEEGQTLADGTYIVVSEATGRYKVISFETIIARSIDAASGQQVNAIALEQQLTSAIKYVTSAELPIVYQVTGHGEEALPAVALNEMALENYTVKDLVLLDQGGVPDDCGILIINAPTSDITEAELNMLNDYFDGFGSAMFFMGMVDQPLPNFSRLFEYYGLEIHQDSMVFETSPGNFYQSPVLLIPDIMTHSITEPLIRQNHRLTAMASQYIRETDVARDELTIEPLLVTSDGAYAKTNMTDVTVPEKEEGDAEGPFTIAVTVTDNREWDSGAGDYKSAKMVVVANSVFLKAQAYAAEPNFDFFVYASNWLSGSGESETMYIKPKNVDVMPLQMDAMQIYIYAGLTVIVIPLMILVTGFAVWRKRRHL